MNSEAIKDLNLTETEIFATDKDGNCILVNPQCEKSFGINATELIGMNVRELENRKEFFPSSTLRAIENKEAVKIIQSNHKGRKLHATSTPVFNDDGEIMYIISQTVDITDYLVLEGKISKMENVIKSYNKEISKLRNKNNIFKSDKIFASSKSMQLLHQQIEMASKFDIIMLLLGETGVGKTEIARWIHSNSHRKNESFVEVNCATIPNNLFETELFGYTAGAFSGASAKGKNGLLHQADGGTVFFDEIGELSIELQTKLLQFIEDKTFRKVGSNKIEKADVRILAATNRNLKKMVKTGDFREDLYYRLSTFPIKVPTLKERIDDIEDLSTYLLSQINKQYDTNKIFSPHLLNQIINYDWPGNIRQLRNVIERLVVTTKGIELTQDFQNSKSEYELWEESNNNNFSINSLSETTEIFKNIKEFSLDNTFNSLHEALNPDSSCSLQKRIEIFEQELFHGFKDKFQSTHEIAKYLGTSQSTISRKLNKYNIQLKN